MKNLSLALLIALSAVACVADGDSIGTLVHEDGRRSPELSPLRQEAPVAALLGRDEDGALALVRLADGVTVARFPLADMDGPADVSAFITEGGTVDHLALMRHDAEEAGGALAFIPATSSGFARSVAHGTYEGQTRVLALEAGALVMQNDLGARWSFASTSGGFHPSTPCPMPASIVSVLTGPERAEVKGFAWSPDAEPLIVTAALVENRWRCQTVSIEPEAPLTSSARVAALDASLGWVLVDASPAGVRVASLTDGKLGPAVQTSHPAGRIEHVEPFSHGDLQGIVVLGSSPPSLALLALRLDEASALAVVASASVDLESVRETTWFSREVVVSAENVWVATPDGVVGFVIASEPKLTLEPVSLPASVAKLRAPIVGLPAL